MVETMVPESIVAHPEKCTGCICCQMICSYTYTSRFNPLLAHIRISLHEGGGIEFTPECTECGLCVEYCAYGALERSGTEDGS